MAMLEGGKNEETLEELSIEYSVAWWVLSHQCGGTSGAEDNVTEASLHLPSATS